MLTSNLYTGGLTIGLLTSTMMITSYFTNDSQEDGIFSGCILLFLIFINLHLAVYEKRMACVEISHRLRKIFDRYRSQYLILMKEHAFNISHGKF